MCIHWCVVLRYSLHWCAGCSTHCIGGCAAHAPPSFYCALLHRWKSKYSYIQYFLVKILHKIYLVQNISGIVHRWKSNILAHNFFGKKSCTKCTWCETLVVLCIGENQNILAHNIHLCIPAQNPPKKGFFQHLWPAGWARPQNLQVLRPGHVNRTDKYKCRAIFYVVLHASSAPIGALYVSMRYLSFRSKPTLLFSLRPDCYELIVQ